ncbi:hypothetical protein OH76DRAFT_1402450 [Lentinus brumalis]|uniref:Secreted protein n=1 Tax=Lentinus brumalis TaxID=2498619 RepID=A0A371DCZ7_9APHY|nr:hypothetical protein OH76DRAFT_1402450 [Polyporus brumalis]
MSKRFRQTQTIMQLLGMVTACVHSEGVRGDDIMRCQGRNDMYMVSAFTGPCASYDCAYVDDRVWRTLTLGCTLL